MSGHIHQFGIILLLLHIQAHIKDSAHEKTHPQIKKLFGDQNYQSQGSQYCLTLFSTILFGLAVSGVDNTPTSIYLKTKNPFSINEQKHFKGGV